MNEFTSWLQDDVGPRKAALSIAKYTEFFVATEQNAIPLASYEALVSEFGPDFLRRYQKVIGWLAATKGLTVNQGLKTEITELQRIRRILDRVPPKSKGYALLRNYWHFQRSRYLNTEITIRTVRLYLTPATAYLKICGYNEPSSVGLSRYLTQSPGQRSSILAFVTYLNTSCGYEIELPSGKQAKSINRKAIEEQLVNMASGKQSEFDLYKWCQLAMLVFHDQKVTYEKFKAGRVAIKSLADGYEIELRGRTYFLPASKF